VAECSDGASTIAAVRAQKPDVLFLDIEMPREPASTLPAKSCRQMARSSSFVTAFRSVCGASLRGACRGLSAQAVRRRSARDDLDACARPLRRGRKGPDEFWRRSMSFDGRGRRRRIAIDCSDHRGPDDDRQGDGPRMDRGGGELRQAARRKVQAFCYVRRWRRSRRSSIRAPSWRVHRSAMVNLDFIGKSPWFTRRPGDHPR